MNPTEAAEHLAHQNDRVLFIAAILVLGIALVWVVRYVITRMEAMVDKANGVGMHVTEVVTRNTVALDNNSETGERTNQVLGNAASVLQGCETELRLCREHRR